MNRRAQSFICIFLSLVCSSEIFAQAQLLEDFRTPGMPLSANTGNTVKGSPYMSDDFCACDVKSTAGIIYRNQFCRYDVFRDILEVKNSKGIIELDPVYIQEFTITYPAQTSRVYRNNIGLDKFNPLGYAEVIHAGEITCIKKVTKELIDDPEATYGSTRKKAFLTKEYYFIRNANDAAFERMKLTKKSLLEKLPAHKSKINEWLKENGSEVKDETALKALLDSLD